MPVQNLKDIILSQVTLTVLRKPKFMQVRLVLLASYTDATLACNGKFYPVHRLVLSTCSEYFSDMFEYITGKNPIIVLKDVECKNLEYLLDYMYIGEVNVKQNELASLVGAAEYLRIKGLAVPDEEPIPRHNSSNKRLSSDYQKCTNPPVKRKRSSHDISESDGNINSKERTVSSHESINTNFETSVFDDSSLIIKSEPQSDDDILDDNFVPDTNVIPKQDNISETRPNPSSEAEVDGKSEVIRKEETVDISDNELNEAEESEIYNNDPFQPDSDASCSQPQEDAMFNFLLLTPNEDIEQDLSNPFLLNFETPTTRKGRRTSYPSNIVYETSESLNRVKFSIGTESGIRYFKCSMCQYISKSKENAARHARIHTGDKPFSCHFCPYRTITKENLKRHYSIHTGDKPFECQYCDYKTTTNDHLKIHTRIHTGEKPFSCQFCPYKAKTKDHLKLHTRIHTGEKPFKCKYCPYRAARNEHLTRHTYIHTGEKPFRCPYCDYKSSLKVSLCSHLLNKH